jgi:hypothetical protein
VPRRISLLALLLLLCASVSAQSRKPSTPVPVVSTEAYRKQLERALIQLRRVEKHPPRRLAPILGTLNKTQRVKRSDGAVQTLSGHEWSRRLNASSGSGSGAPATRADVESARKSLELQLRELDAWSKSTFVASDAQIIMSQLAASGQIRVGPTFWQQWLGDVRKWFRNLTQSFMRWIASLFPTAKPGAMPKIDPLWIQLFFYATALALLSLLVYLAWRALGGRIGKRGARRGVFAESEDAELLRLPPDELRLRAQQFASEENFREALRHLYIALLLEFELGGVWRYDARRTNWEHVAALRSNEEYSRLVPALSYVTRTFDRVRYGNAAFGESDWQHFEKEVDLVASEVRPATA